MIKWSFSGLKDYRNCPKQFYEVKVAKNFTKKETEQMRYGTEVHKALEDYVRDGTPLRKNYRHYQPIMDAVCEIPGTRYLEQRMALTEKHTPCDFDAEDYWVRGIVDFMAVDGELAHIIDYKTGSNRYADMRQLKLMALMAKAHFPELKRIKAGLLFVAHNCFMEEEYSFIEPGKSFLWSYFEPDLIRLKFSYESGDWPTNPTGLCGWCPVKSCPHHRGR